MDILTFWRAHPDYWIPVTAEEKARADQDIYTTYYTYDHTSDSVYGRIIYLDQFMRHFQRILGTAVISEDAIQTHRRAAVDLVRAHADRLHTADELELVFACMPFKHLGLYDELFEYIHVRWLPYQAPGVQTPSAHPLLHKFYMDSYKKAYTLPAIARKLITEHEEKMYEAAEICEYYPPAYESEGWTPPTNVTHKFTLPLANPCIVSLSGGVDSMVMLALLVATRRPVVAAHIVYGNRAVSRQEYAFIARYCARLGVPLYVYKIEWLRRGEVEREFYESVTRDIRFHVYKAVAAACGVTTEPTVLLGHIQEDVVENIWTNLTKCQHLDNLAGMSASDVQMGVRICRPFLQMEKSQIYELSSMYAIPYLKNTTPAWSNRGKFRTTFYDATHAQYGAQVDKKMLEVAGLLQAQSAMLERLIYNPIYASYNSVARTLDITPAVTAGLDASGWATIFTHLCHTCLGVRKPSIHAVREFARRILRCGTTPRRMDMRGDLQIRVTVTGNQWILTFMQ